MQSSWSGRPISGSLTLASAVSTCSRVGSGELMPLMLRAEDTHAHAMSPARGWGRLPGALAAYDRAGRRVEDQRGVMRLRVEVEHPPWRVERTGGLVVGVRYRL